MKLLLIILAGGILSCAPMRKAGSTNSADHLIDLSPSQQELQQAFNADTGAARLLLIVSPT